MKANNDENSSIDSYGKILAMPPKARTIGSKSVKPLSAGSSKGSGKLISSRGPRLNTCRSPDRNKDGCSEASVDVISYLEEEVLWKLLPFYCIFTPVLGTVVLDPYLHMITFFAPARYVRRATLLQRVNTLILLPYVL
jgi:hypothetical protein